MEKKLGSAMINFISTEFHQTSVINRGVRRMDYLLYHGILMDLQRLRNFQRNLVP